MYDVVLVAFEGPDRYSFVGGLATRMIDLAEALVDRGYLVHQLFVGDPKLPAREERKEGRLEPARGEHVAHFLGVLADALERRHEARAIIRALPCTT